MSMQPNANPNSGIDPISEFLKRAKPQTHRALYELIVGGYLRMALGVAIYVIYPDWVTFVIAFFVVTSGMGVLVNLSHESQHSSLLPNKRWNDWVGAWLCAYPIGSIYGSSRAVHLAHHKYLNTVADPDRHFHVEDDKSNPLQFLAYFSKLLLGGQLWTSIVVNGFLRGRKAGGDGSQPEAADYSNVIKMPRRQYPEIANLLPVQLVIFCLLWLVSGKWWLYFALWFAPVATLGTLLGYIRGFIDHARLYDDDEKKSEARLITVPNPPAFDRLFFTGLDFHFHAEHHFFPSVPHYYLPRLHRLMQADPSYRNKYLLRSSYVSFLWQYWRQICSGKQSRTTERPVQDTIRWGTKRKPKVLFIMPKMAPSFWGMEYSAPYGGFRYTCPPLGILTLAGAISPEYEVEIRDENVGPVDYDTDADIVALSGILLHHFQVKRLVSLAKYFRSMGKLICVGGPVANLAPEVVRAHCDVLFEGEGELTWPQFMKDYEAGDWKDKYTQVDKIHMSDSPIPRIDLVKAHTYGVGMIQTTRGCPFTCEFCDIIVMYGRKVRTKPIAKVMREVELWSQQGYDFIFFSDDNFVGNRPYCKELLREIIGYNRKRAHPLAFYTQASIDMARDTELLELLRDANFSTVFIGIESPRKDSLAETLKVQNVHTENIVDAIHKIQSYGIWVSGGMIVGFDHDDPAIFQEQFDFLQQAGVVFAQMSILEAMPKTPLYERMRQSGRLVEYREGLATNIQPLNMTQDELLQGYTKLIQKVYSPDAYVERFLINLQNMKESKFELDNPPNRFKYLVASLKIAGYYLFTLDRTRRDFFARMVKGTMAIQPAAWRWTLRYLLNFIHFHTYAQKHVLVVVAPMTQPVLEKAS